MGLGAVSPRPWPGPYTDWVVFPEAWGEVKGWRCQLPIPHIWARPVGSSLGRDWGHWVNFQELWVRPGSGVQEPAGRIALLSPLLLVAGSFLGNELSPADNPSNPWTSKSTALRSGQCSFRLALSGNNWRHFLMIKSPGNFPMS